MSNQVLHLFNFNEKTSSVIISGDLPDIKRLCSGFSLSQCLVVYDSNTGQATDVIPGIGNVRRCILSSGERTKKWQSVEQIISTAVQAGIGRDGLFIGIGGGVVTDLTAFAASIYMRGVSVRLVSTTILGMVDASVGGKTGFDFLGIKNLVGTFYPAEEIYMPLSVLGSLPGTEWKSGFAEILKTGILTDPEIISILEEHPINFNNPLVRTNAISQGWFADLIHRCVAAKGKIVEADPEETGTERALLNLGHTYGHALEAVAGLGTVSHGEAVAWGIGRACDLGTLLGITPEHRKKRIMNLLEHFGYCGKPVYPIKEFNPEALVQAMYSDKKKKEGLLRFVIPTAEGAMIKTITNEETKLVIKTLV